MFCCEDCVFKLSVTKQHSDNKCDMIPPESYMCLIVLVVLCSVSRKHDTPLAAAKCSAQILHLDMHANSCARENTQIDMAEDLDPDVEYVLLNKQLGSKSFRWIVERWVWLFLFDFQKQCLHSR